MTAKEYWEKFENGMALEFADELKPCRLCPAITVCDPETYARSYTCAKTLLTVSRAQKAGRQGVLALPTIVSRPPTF